MHRPGTELKTWICALTGTQTQNLLVYGMTLQSTKPPAGHSMDILAFLFSPKTQTAHPAPSFSFFFLFCYEQIFGDHPTTATSRYCPLTLKHGGNGLQQACPPASHTFVQLSPKVCDSLLTNMPGQGQGPLSLMVI